MKIPSPHARRPNAFTLVELLTVIAIIAVLMGLLFPAIGSAKNAAKKVQAKNDVTQIVTAVKAYYTEYGKYPIQGGETEFGPNGTGSNNLFDVLRANGQGRDNPTGSDKMNPRRIVFIELPVAKDASAPKSGIGPNDGKLYDPWGNEYLIRIDANYDNLVANPAGSGDLNTGVIAWSVGKDSATAKKDDDVLSWQ